MKAITGNLLRNGRVVYLTLDGTWTDHLAKAHTFADDDAEGALESAKQRVIEIAGAYLIEVNAGAAAGREALRETIRSAGPTVRRDLGKQATAPR